MTDFPAFRDHIIESGYVLDPEGEHSEFVSGMHGQKLDFDNIDEHADPLYREWIDVNESFIRDNFSRLPEVILGVANGTNRIATDTARRFDGEVLGMVSVKDKQDSKVLYLSNLVRHALNEIKPQLVVVAEDVGTTGSNSVQVANAARESGAKKVIVVTTWKRRERLERLEEAGIEHLAIIDEPLATYTEEDCRTLVEGFCKRGWKFKPRGK